MTDQVNPTLKIAEDLFKSIAWDTAVNVWLASVFVAAPYLNVWPLRSIVTGIVGLVSGSFFNVFRTFFDCAAVPFINAANKRAFETAVVESKIIGYDKGINSDEYKKAKENARQRFIASSQFNG